MYFLVDLIKALYDVLLLLCIFFLQGTRDIAIATYFMVMDRLPPTMHYNESFHEIRNIGPLLSFAQEINDNRLENKDESFLQREKHFLNWSGTEIAESIRDGKVSVTGVVEGYIGQCIKVNAYLNAVAINRFAEAMEEAKECDLKLKKWFEMTRKKSNTLTSEKLDRYYIENYGLFFGVPFVVKENMEVKGLAYTMGMVARKNIKGEGTCTAVQRMLDQGAILLATTNVSEVCLWMESYNNVYGRTNNPYDFNRTCGGSSGGCAALVSSAGAPIAITSDVGGSTRIPAAFNCLFGHKPTGGTVPNSRTIPTASGNQSRYCQIGPTSRYAHDLLPMLKTMAGPCDGDDKCVNVDFTDTEKMDFKKLKVYFIEQPAQGNFLVSKVNQESVRAQKKLLDYFTSQGAVVKKVDIPQFKYSFDIWVAKIKQSSTERFSAKISQGLENEVLASPIMELGKFLFGQSNHTLPLIGLQLLDDITTFWMDYFPSLDPTPMYLNRFDELTTVMKRILGDNNSILVYPSLPNPAGMHNEDVLYFPNSGYCSIFNVTEFPSTAIPLGLNKDNIPIGVQIVANHWNDELCLKTAVALNQANVSKWIPAPVLI